MEALDFFLNDGLRTRVELIPNFIQKLEALLGALKQQDTFDFIASSLLLAYDGDYKDVNQGGRDVEVDVRLIDFDHAVIKEPRNHDDDSGIIAGISSLVDIMQRLLYRTNHSYSFFLLPKLPKDERELNHEDNIKRIDSMPELHATSRFAKFSPIFFFFFCLKLMNASLEMVQSFKVIFKREENISLPLNKDFVSFWIRNFFITINRKTI